MPLVDNSTPCEAEVQESAVSSHFSLPVIMFTHDFLKMCIDNALGRIPMLLALSILGNMDTSRGFIHKFKVKDKAKLFSCSEARIHQSLHILRDLKFANLKLRHGKVSGRVMIKSMLAGAVLSQYERHRDRQESGDIDIDEEFETGGHAMPVGMLHHLQLMTHIQGNTTAAHLRLMMACCLNIDVQTGELKEKRPCEWADLAGLHRTWAVEGFAHFNEIGVSQTKTDYDVIGRLPYVSLSNGVFRLLELKREERRGDAKDRFTEKCVTLYEAFGIQLTGLAHDIIENAWRLLGEEADKILKRSREKMAKVLGRDPIGEVKRRRIVESADSGTIPHRDTLSFGEVLELPFA